MGLKVGGERRWNAIIFCTSIENNEDRVEKKGKSMKGGGRYKERIDHTDSIGPVLNL